MFPLEGLSDRDMKLKGFVWLDYMRPKKRDDVFLWQDDNSPKSIEEKEDKSEDEKPDKPKGIKPTGQPGNKNSKSDKPVGPPPGGTH